MSGQWPIRRWELRSGFYYALGFGLFGPGLQPTRQQDVKALAQNHGPIGNRPWPLSVRFVQLIAAGWSRAGLPVEREHGARRFSKRGRAVAHLP